jgi:hypothetical protein
MMVAASGGAMTQAALEPLNAAGFATTIAQAGRELSIGLIGAADLNVREELETFLQRVHDFASEQRLERVTLDMRALEFINSSCLATIVHWIELRELLVGHRYRICFVADKNNTWHHRTLRILSGLYCEVLTVFR